MVQDHNRRRRPGQLPETTVQQRPTTANYNPVLYIDQNGHLRAEWYNGTAATITSQNSVDDGVWHHAVLTTAVNGSTTTQTLTIDGIPQGTPLTGTISLTFATSPYVDFGAGYIGGNWPDKVNYKRSGYNAYPDYFNGQISDIEITSNR